MNKKETKRRYTYKTHYVYDEKLKENSLTEKEKEIIELARNKDHILKYIKRELDPITEKYEYIEKEINYKKDWDNTLQLLEQNESLLKTEKVKI